MKNLLRPMFALMALLGTLCLPMAAGAQSAQAGETKAAMCIGCHGIPDYKASFPEVYRVPMIAGQSEKYLAAALAQYKRGDRKHPSMRGVATTLTDQDMADLVAFYAKAGKSEPVPAALTSTVPANVAALLARGNCASCHGANYSAPIDPSYPKLAGQHADYLYVALCGYQTDKNPLIGRNNAIMVGMARLYTPAELKVLSKYFASLPGEMRTNQQPRFR